MSAVTAGASGNALSLTRTALVLSLAATAPLLLFGSGSLTLMIGASMTALVYAIALALTIIRPRFGVPFAGGVAVVAIVPLTVVAYFGTALGLVGGGIRAGASLLILLGLPILLQIGLLIAAILAARGAEPALAGWLAGGAAALVGLVIIHDFATWKEPAHFPTAAERAHERDIREDNSRLDAMWAAVARCPGEYAAKHPERGYPDRLEAMADCLPPEVASGKYEHPFFYFPGPADASGTVRRYVLCAGASGRVMTFDERGRLVPGGTDCRHLIVRWPDVHTIGSCLVYYAALHPAEGYPRRLAQIGPAGTGCLVPQPLLDQKYVFGDAGLFVGDFLRFEYKPHDADATGVVRGYSILDHSATKTIAYDETGR